MCVLGTPQCQNCCRNKAVCISATSHAGSTKFTGQPHLDSRADQGNHKYVFTSTICSLSGFAFNSSFGLNDQIIFSSFWSNINIYIYFFFTKIIFQRQRLFLIILLWSRSSWLALTQIRFLPHLSTYLKSPDSYMDTVVCHGCTQCKWTLYDTSRWIHTLKTALPKRKNLSRSCVWCVCSQCVTTASSKKC